MKAPISWINEYAKINVSKKEYEHLMTMSGSKVEGIEDLAKEFKNVVVGKIEKIESHPDADKLIVCQVDIGNDTTIQIVTGAKNVSHGDLVPIAKHKSKLPGGVKITKGKLRGVVSNGMMCSIHELGLTKNDCPEADEDGIYIINHLNVHPGQDITEALGLDESIVEFEITSNRVDCMNVVGLARETAATLDVSFNPPEINVETIDEKIDNYLKVEIKDFDLCPRYVARMVKNVKVGPSPMWMQKKLKSCGVRPINNIVDITNYVNLELGQPMHAFDLDYIKGNKIVVKRAQNSKFITLDSIEREIDGSMLMINDGEKEIAIAGVMGGENSEVKEDTNVVVFESATFNPSSIRATSKKLSLQTEASLRFEKGLDKNLSLLAANRACQLVNMLGCGEVLNGIIDVNDGNFELVEVPFDPEYINNHLGTSITLEQMITILRKVGFKVDLERMLVISPSFRNDIELPVDIAEEVARIYGYDNIEELTVKGSGTWGGKNFKQKLEDKIISLMTGMGFYEIQTYSFIGPADYEKIKRNFNDSVSVLNPFGVETSLMRTTGLCGMMDTISRNISHKALSGEFFEMAKTYKKSDEKLPVEAIEIVVGSYGKGDFYNLKGAVDSLLGMLGINQYEYVPFSDSDFYHPGRCAKIISNNMEIAIIGEVHPKVADNYAIDEKCYISQISFDLLKELCNLEHKFEVLNKYPVVTRDLALVVSEDILVGDIEKCIKNNAGTYLQDIQLFDIYRGKQIGQGFKSVAYAIKFQSSEKTLTDNEINEVFEKILSALKNQLDAKLR